jgi:hypothetical protein
MPLSLSLFNPSGHGRLRAIAALLLLSGCFFVPALLPRPTCAGAAPATATHDNSDLRAGDPARGLPLITAAGKEVSGRFVGEDAGSVMLKVKGAGRKLRRVPREQIRRREFRSPMPGGYDTLLSRQQLADLIAFLKSLSPKAQPKPPRHPEEEAASNARTCTRSIALASSRPPARARHRAATKFSSPGSPRSRRRSRRPILAPPCAYR